MTARPLAWPLFLAAGVPPASADSRVASGRLAAHTASNPWRLAFHENGRAILAESGARGTGSLGALAFRTAAGWSRATRVLSPLLPAEVDTVADYGRGAGAVRLADRPNRFELLASPRGRSSARVGNSGGRLKSVERRRRWDLRITGARRARYRVRASLATLRRPFAVCAVCLEGKACPGAPGARTAGAGCSA